MIKSDMGTVMVSGSKLLVLAELSTIIKGMNKSFEKDEIMEAVENGFKSDAEIEAEFSKSKQGFKEFLKELIEGMD